MTKYCFRDIIEHLFLIINIEHLFLFISKVSHLTYFYYLYKMSQIQFNSVNAFPTGLYNYASGFATK